MNVRYWVRHPLLLCRRIYYYSYERAHPDEPFLAPGAVRFLDQHLPRLGRGFEWGSGRSTPWLAMRLASLVAVEHDGDWHRDISSRLQAQAIQNVDYRLIALEHLPDEPTGPHYDLMPRYAACIRAFPDAYFDFIAVDGHYRQACVLECQPKLAPRGLLLIDDTSWIPIEEWGVPLQWPVVHQSRKVITTTTIWMKPASEPGQGQVWCAGRRLEH